MAKAKVKTTLDDDDNVVTMTSPDPESTDAADLGLTEGAPLSADVDMSTLASEGTGELLRPQALGLNVGVGKPSRTSRIRTHSEARFWPYAYSWELEVPGEFEKISLIVAPALAPLLGDDARRRRFALYCTADGNLRFWPYAVDEVGEPASPHAASVHEACLHAREQWVTAEYRKGGGYQAYPARVGREPDWPDKSPLELLKIAHKGRLIVDESHPRLREYLERKPL